MPAGTPVTRVVVDSSLFSGPLTASGWGPADAPSSYAAPVTATAVDGARVSPGSHARSGQPGLDAGAALADALGAPGATVVLGEAPAGARGARRRCSRRRSPGWSSRRSRSRTTCSPRRWPGTSPSPRDLPATFEGAAQAVTDAVAEAGVDVSGVDPQPTAAGSPARTRSPPAC